jgi:hypothetical protein
MSRVVWKYVLSPGENVISAPRGSRIVAVGPAMPGANGPAVWVEREKDADPTVTMRVAAIGTGHPVPSEALHIGSAWCGPFMWHVYELEVTA